MHNQILILTLCEEQIVENVSMYMINKFLLLNYSYWWMVKIKLYNRDNKWEIIPILTHNNHEILTNINMMLYSVYVRNFK